MPARRMTHKQIADDLSARIESGEYPPGAQLPAQPDLALLYSVSKATIEKVHIILRERGFTYSEPGRGVFVRESD